MSEGRLYILWNINILEEYLLTCCVFLKFYFWKVISPKYSIDSRPIYSNDTITILGSSKCTFRISKFQFSHSRRIENFKKKEKINNNKRPRTTRKKSTTRTVDEKPHAAPGGKANWTRLSRHRYRYRIHKHRH